MEQLIKYLNNLWTNTLSPTIKSHWDKADKRTDRIVNSVREDISINNTNDISNPIVEAQNATIEAIKNIPRVDIPKTDLVSLEGKLDTINKTLQDKKMEVNVGETKLELTPVIKAIEKIKLEVPKMERQEVIDYTLILDEICGILEKPKDFTEIKKVQELLKPLSKTKDIAVVCEYLQTLIDKPVPEFPELPMHKGRIMVEVDRAGGGGGGGLTSVESEALQGVATEAKQDDIIEAIGNIKIDTGDIDLNTDGLETLATDTNAKLDTLNGKQNEIIEEISNKDLMISIRNLMQAIANPIYGDKSLNRLRTDAQVVFTNTSQTLGTVTTVGGLTNIDGYQGKLQVINQNNSAWASVVRSRIS